MPEKLGSAELWNYTPFMLERAFRLLAILLLTFLSSSVATVASKPNLVLITVSSGRADRMGFSGGKAGVTPSLDGLASRALVFEHAYTQTPDTVVSHATILSGAYPQSTGVNDISGALSGSLPYLPDLLKARGYRTAAFVGAGQLNPKNGRAQGFDRGFQTFNSHSATGTPSVRVELGSASRSGNQVVTQATAWIARDSQGPFFIWVELNDADSPKTSYAAGIGATDAAIGRFLASLKQQKLFANAAILVTADHGESLGAHGEDTHGIFLYDETIQVPMLLKLPDTELMVKRVSAKVRLVDIAPTLLEVAGVAVPSQMQGQSLLRIARASGAADQPVYSRCDLPQRGFGWSPIESWRAGKYLYIRAPKPELYDLTADPGATRNLAESSKATLDTMAAQLENFSRRISGEGGKTGNAQLSSSEMQKLASLGYVGLQKTAGASAAATGIDPKDKIATANRVLEAARAVAQAKPGRAIGILNALVASDPNLYLAEYTLGAALAQKGQHAEAVKHLHKAIELQPDSAWAHYYIGASLLKMGDYKTAVVHLEIAAGRLPGLKAARSALDEARYHLAEKRDRAIRR